MAVDRTALEHLRNGREALQREVDRLNAAIAELDAVIEHVDGAGRQVGPAVGVRREGEEVRNSRPVEALQKGRGPAKRAKIPNDGDSGKSADSVAEQADEGDQAGKPDDADSDDYTPPLNLGQPWEPTT